MYKLWSNWNKIEDLLSETLFTIHVSILLHYCETCLEEWSDTAEVFTFLTLVYFSLSLSILLLFLFQLLLTLKFSEPSSPSILVQFSLSSFHLNVTYSTYIKITKCSRNIYSGISWFKFNWFFRAVWIGSAQTRKQFIPFKLK